MTQKFSPRDETPHAPQTLLVGVDLTAAGERAARRAAYIGARRGAQIHLVHVLSEAATPAERKRAERSLERACGVLRTVGQELGVHLTPLVRVRCGEAATELIRDGREIGTELLIVGRGRRDGILGTTAKRITHLNDGPTLLVGRRVAGPYRRPLVAAEIDPSARNVIELTCRAVGDSEVPVRVVHAYHVPFEAMHKRAGDGSVEHYAREARDTAQRELTTELSRFNLSGCALEAVVRAGDPRTVIAREAKRYRADLVAMGTHGRSGVVYALLGSVAEWAVQNVTRDVLVSRPVHFTFVGS